MWEGGKGGRCVRLTILPPSCAQCPKIPGALTSRSPWGLSRTIQGQLYISYTFCIILATDSVVKQNISAFPRSISIYQSTRCNIPEDINLQQHRCEHLKTRAIPTFLHSTMIGIMLLLPAPNTYLGLLRTEHEFFHTLVSGHETLFSRKPCFI